MYQLIELLIESLGQIEGNEFAEAVGKFPVPEVLLHVTEKDSVESIFKTGLKFSKKRTSTGGFIRGVYLTDDVDGVLGADFPIKNPVILKVQTKGLTLFPDPEFYPDYTAEGLVADLLKTDAVGLYVYSDAEIPVDSILKEVDQVSDHSFKWR